MVKAAAKAKGQAAKALQPALVDAPLPKAAVGAPRGPPPRAERPAQEAQALPKAKQTAADLQAHLADATGLSPRDVKLVVDAIWETCAKSLREDGVFRLPSMALLRAKRTAARPARTKAMFGKEVILQAKPAGKKLSAVVLKPLKDAVMAEE